MQFTEAQRRAGVVLLALALLGGSFAAGRWAAPTKVQTVDRVVERTVTVKDTEAERRVAELTAQVETLKSHTHVERRTVVHPDGTRERTVVADRQVDRTEQTEKHTATTETQRQVQATETVRETVREKLVERPAPQWFVGPTVTFTPALRDPLAAGIVVGRHVAGPVALSLGVTVPVSQPVQVPAFSLSATVAF
jgi:hypothetical protein